MRTPDVDGSAEPSAELAIPVVRPLRLVVDNAPAVPQRRRAPRRQVVAGYAVERRQADRRDARPGLDGLLRTVLADSWR